MRVMRMVLPENIYNIGGHGDPLQLAILETQKGRGFLTTKGLENF